jgi:hypothetical protein
MAGSLSASGVPALSIQWGAWAGGGMAAGDAGTAARVERTGIALLLPERGLAALSAGDTQSDHLHRHSPSLLTPILGQFE